MAPHETTTTFAEYVSGTPFRSTCTVVTSRPDGLVSRRLTKAFVTRVTFGCSRAGSKQITCVSAFDWTRHGTPSQVSHRMQRLRPGFCSSSMRPIGIGNGRYPWRVKPSKIAWMRGSWLIGGWRYGALAGGSVG